MKIKSLLLFELIFLAKMSSLTAQNVLNKDYNMFRGEDVITKQQVKYKHPGRAGANVLWDFSKQEAINEKYKLFYTQSESDSVITGCEHRTLYHYLLKNDSLFCLGYENPTTLMRNCNPELILIFPFTFQKKIENYFYGTGEYCRRLNITAQGKTLTQADAYGMIILPNGDTLKHVLRVHTLKKIAERMIPYELKDSVVSSIVNIDSINYHLKNDNVYMQVDTYRWYADGYRYPIFETVESVTYKYQKPFKHFNTAFFYSPDEHSYLNDDPENIAKLEELEKADKNSCSGGNIDKKNLVDNIINYDYSISPNSNSFSVKYNLKEKAEVAFTLYDIQGRLLANFPQSIQTSGYYEQDFSFENNSEHEFILRIVVNGIVYGEKIFKP